MPLASDDNTKFLTWFGDFIGRHEGFKPSNVSRWFDRVEKSHTSLRALLGGTRFEKKIKIKSQQGSLNPEDVYDEVNVINQLLPGFLNYHGYDASVLLTPNINQGSHSSTRIAKTIQTYAAKQVKDRRLTTNGLQEIETMLSKLGEKWGKARTSDIELDVTITTSAKAFALLGHYGPDIDSCFRQGSERPIQKYVLGQTDNSFVCLISQHDKVKNKDRVVSRSFGFFTDELKIAHFCNYYFRPGFAEGDGIAAITSVMNSLWKDAVEFHENKMVIHGSPDSIYHNPYGKWSFSKGKNTNVNTTIVYPNENFIRFFLCLVCGREARADTYWGEIDGNFVCEICVDRAPRCELTGKRTFKMLQQVLDQDGYLILVHPEEAAKLSKCIICEKTTVENGLHKIGRYENVCSSCMETSFSQCEVCGDLVPDEEIVHDDICSECFGEDEPELELITFD